MKTDQTLKGVYAITDTKLMGDNLIPMARQAISAGINILQYRNKLATIEVQHQEASELARLCEKYNVVFIINDNIELALEVNADGIHLGQKDTNINHARSQLGENKIIGVSCNNKIELALAAEKNGADYVAFGRFFSSQTKPDAPQAEISLLSNARKSIKLPIVAIGGINHKTAPSLIKEGADMLAIVQGIFGAKDIFSSTQKFVELFEDTKLNIINPVTSD